MQVSERDALYDQTNGTSVSTKPSALDWFNASSSFGLGVLGTFFGGNKNATTNNAAPGAPGAGGGNAEDKKDYTMWYVGGALIVTGIVLYFVFKKS
jgi:hypothetical protein